LAAAVLSSEGPVHQGGLYSKPEDLKRMLIGMRPSSRFCVEELSGHAPGVLEEATSLFRPEIGVVTCVSYDHHKAFQNLEATAEEKATLVEFLPANGAAILNVDDPRVWAMRERTRARVIGCGFSSEADLSAEEISASWPHRLSFTAVHKTNRVRVQTRLVGAHWTFAALAALGVGLARGIPLEQGASNLALAKPMFGRMSPHETRDGVDFILDSWKSPYETLSATLEFVAGARARRKFFVLGHLSDYKGTAAVKYLRVARRALQVADEVLFVTPLNSSMRKLDSDAGAQRLKTFDTLFELNAYLQPRLESGDLVVLKGSLRPDHLERVYLDRDRGVRCWRQRCGYRDRCFDCRHWDTKYVPNDSACA
jgi:UDP-N-acetylmuramoyl-tripeptide--D-alanyl-D-alanine ligase